VSDTVQQAVAATQQAIVRVLTEGIDLQSLSVDERKKLADELRKGSAHETEKIVRLGLPRIMRLKEFAVYSLTPNANLTSCCSTSTNFRIVGTVWDCFFQRATISIWPASSASR
jgi:hypothetical protein